MATLEASVRPPTRLHQGPFVNEPLTDFSKEENARPMRAAIEKVRGQLGREYDLIIGGKHFKTTDKIKSINPARPSQLVGLHQKAGKEQVEPGVIAPAIGDCGAASALLGLVHVLDTAKPKQRIFLATYGFGAGSDALVLEVTAGIESRRPKVPLAHALYQRKAMVDYATACRLEYKYMQDSSPLYI